MLISCLGKRDKGEVGLSNYLAALIKTGGVLHRGLCRKYIHHLLKINKAFSSITLNQLDDSGGYAKHI
jgi:hypothetical protein